MHRTAITERIEEVLDKRMNRRSLVIGAAAGAASLALLAACGDEDTLPDADDDVAAVDTDDEDVEEEEEEEEPDEHDDEEEDEEDDAEAEPTAPAVVSGDRLNITYWGSFSGVLGEAEVDVVNRFNESQDEIFVDYQYQGTYEETAQALTQALQAQQAPAVSLLSDVWWFRFYVNQMLEPLDDYIAAHDLDMDDYVESLLNEGVRQGQTFWIPFARSTPIFYYNKEMWDEAGLPDRGPETWDEFDEWVPELVRMNGDSIDRSAFAHPGAASYIAWLFQCVIWQYGGSYSDPDFTIRINEEAGVEAGEFYRRSVAEQWATTPDDLNLEFTNRLTASMMASTAALGTLTATADFEIGSAFLPEKYDFGCCTGGAGLALLATVSDEEKEAGFEFIKFATSPEITAIWSQATGYMPVRNSAESEMQDFYEENPNFRTAVEQLAYTTPQDAARVFIPGGDQIIGRGLERITINQEEPQPVFDDVADTLEEEAEPVIEQVQAVEG
jgi:sn-glycerol 3-phosphate transport system substrate-binding protein